MVPQLLLLCMWSLGLGIALCKHGEPKDGKYNVFIALLGVVIEAALLWWGGFFAPLM